MTLYDLILDIYHTILNQFGLIGLLLLGLFVLLLLGLLLSWRVTYYLWNRLLEETEARIESEKRAYTLSSKFAKIVEDIEEETKLEKLLELAKKTAD